MLCKLRVPSPASLSGSLCSIPAVAPRALARFAAKLARLSALPYTVDDPALASFYTLDISTCSLSLSRLPADLFLLTCVIPGEIPVPKKAAAGFLGGLGGGRKGGGFLAEIRFYPAIEEGKALQELVPRISPFGGHCLQPCVPWKRPIWDPRVAPESFAPKSERSAAPSMYSIFNTPCFIHRMNFPDNAVWIGPSPLLPYSCPVTTILFPFCRSLGSKTETAVFSKLFQCDLNPGPYLGK